MEKLTPLLPLLLVACGTPQPKADAGTDAGADAGPTRATDCMPAPMHLEAVAACAPAATDYRPRDGGDTWPACISDDNVYHPISPNISSIARVSGFEEIAALLWRDAKIPSRQDFIDARVIYAQSEGLDSRVQRREDVHYPAPAALDGGTAAKCSDVGVPAQYPDRCVGPAKLLPILNDAFARGAMGEAPRLHAARIEAALLWFLYVSTLSEVMSCGAKPQDCDSCWAYFAGGGPRAAPLGLGKVISSLGPDTYDRGYDATLAVRSCRKLDNYTCAPADASHPLHAPHRLHRHRQGQSV